MQQATQLRDFWYVIARSSDLGKHPLARKLNGRALAVFRDERGTACVLDAVCPHRGANLALGRVIGGHVACPYHGWRFDGTGTCTHVPSSREGRCPPGRVVESFAVIEQQGLIWTCLGTPVAAPPRFDVLDDPTLHGFCREVQAKLPFDWWVENALDYAHLPFIHPSTIGGEGSSIEDFVIERRADELGFVARSQAENRSLVARMLKLETNVVTTLAMPGNTLFDVDLGRGRRQVILALATPEDGSSTRVWNFALRNFLRLPFADTVGMWFLRAILREDVAIAEKSLELMSIDREHMLSTRADALGLEFLRLMRLWRSREATQHQLAL
jgi:phenylpropionate dioxygenase-like ring-hydroxylating dioxygenase large terminal subunit